MSVIYYTKEHEWIEVRDSIARVGITDFAQSQLGELVFAELPDVGFVMEQNNPVGVLESVKAASDIFAPVDGKVVRVNENVTEEPSLINDSPQERGWLWEMEMTDLQQTGDLMDHDAYKTLLEA